jgi:hypothetical protein
MLILPTNSRSQSTHPYQTKQPDAITTATKSAGNYTAIAITHPNRNQRAHQADRVVEVVIESAETLIINQKKTNGEDRRTVDIPERRTPARPEAAP